LILLRERRDEAVHRREILDGVWSDVVVSDGALSQAIRTVRRTLGDDVREPVFIRTHSRHGYQFVYPDVVEEADDTALPSTPTGGQEREGELEIQLERLIGAASGSDDDDRREAAERIHTLDSDEALRRLDRRPGHEAARALLRDTRWDVAGAGEIPLLGRPGGLTAFRLLVVLRLRRAFDLARSRWLAASSGGGAAGALVGGLGGVALLLVSPSSAPASLPFVLALVGAAIGSVGAAGVGAGLAVAEALARSMRGLALVLCGGLGGGLAGVVAHTLGRWTLQDLFGHDLSAVGGGFEGLVVGAAVGLGYALSTPRPGGGGMATPRGKMRLVAAIGTGCVCAVASVGLAAVGGNLGGQSLDFVARSFQGSQVGLAPLARLFGESELGPLTRGVLSAVEGLFFGFGVTIGLTRRPR